MVENGTLMQYFEQNISGDGKLWKNLTLDATKLKNAGVTSVWLPPAFKGVDGAKDAGFTPYDLYDLGEFRQKGSARTKYGTKKEYVEAVSALKDKGIGTYADMVFDCKCGADDIEDVPAAEFNRSSTYQMVGEDKTIGGVTRFTFPGRKGKYSDFIWCWKHFKGIDWDQKKVVEDLVKNPEVSEKIKTALSKYDYIMGADIDFSKEEVLQEFVRWAIWYVNTVGISGVSLTSAEKVPAEFFRSFLYQLRQVMEPVEKSEDDDEQKVFAMGECWMEDVNALSGYLGSLHQEASLLDIPLHKNLFYAAQAKGAYDLRRIFDGTLVARDPMHAITFVDCHLTQPGGAHESWVEDWFKSLAYSLILLRRDGYPCVFYGDYKGIPQDKYKGDKAMLDKLMKLRKQKAYGEQHDYFDDPDCIGWTREGDAEHKDSGLAVILSDGKGGTKRMYIGRQFAGAHFSDVMGNAKYNIKIDDDGCGEFYVNRGAVAVWVRRESK